MNSAAFEHCCFTSRAETTEAIVGAVTGSPAAPHTLLLGSYDDGHLRYTGRTTNLTQAASGRLVGLLAPAWRGHP
ncbi:hypothetical protein ACFYWX_31955 [Streptomyces sp. NPDC002888]|uniref:hypothetical protein n=1 Tax=Streptomyces sp. NPDC002888 TaxID=3364668 RepID=UPI00367E736A